MKRRNFLATDAASATGLAMFPGNLFAKESKRLNQANFPKRLLFTMDGDWKELESYVDIAVHEPAHVQATHCN